MGEKERLNLENILDDISKLYFVTQININLSSEDKEEKLFLNYYYDYWSLATNDNVDLIGEAYVFENDDNWYVDIVKSIYFDSKGDEIEIEINKHYKIGEINMLVFNCRLDCCQHFNYNTAYKEWYLLEDDKTTKIGHSLLVWADNQQKLEQK